MTSAQTYPVATVPPPDSATSLGSKMLNKVPEITLYFWIIKVLCSTVGETAADNLNGNLGLGTNVTTFIFLGAILALVVFLAVSKRDVIKAKALSPSWAESAARGEAGVLVVTGHATTTQALLDTVRAPAARGKARFFVLVPNPAHLSLHDGARSVEDNEEILKGALPKMQEQVGTTVEGGIATDSNAYDDIVAAMEGDAFGEVIIETPPSHLSHWLHTDLPSRISDLGYPVTVVPATSERGPSPGRRVALGCTDRLG